MKPKVFFPPVHLRKEPRRTDMLIALSLSTAASLGFTVLSVSNLEWEDKISLSRGFGLFLLGSIFFTSSFSLLNHCVLRTNVGQKLVKRHKLATSDVLDVNNKVISAVQALFCCITGGTVCIYSCSRDVLHTSHYFSEAYAWFGAAYFFYDIWSMYKVHCASLNCSNMNGDYKGKNVAGLKLFLNYLKLNPVIVFHHIFIGLFGFLVITYLRGGLGDCVFGFIYLMEASTPFVSLRGIISRFGQKTSKLYVVNGLVMLVLFFFCRIAMFPYSIYLYACAVNVDFVTAVTMLPTGCKVSILFLLLPQIYWFFLMLKGAIKVLRPKRNLGKKRRVPGSSSAT